MKRIALPPYPDGWYHVAFSEEVATGAVQLIRYFGQDFALFRAEDGKAHVVEAYCPHLGANLAIGGRVEGSTIRCPFHGWRFDARGDCVEIPRSRCIPEGTRLRTWPVDEVNGSILMFHHHKGASPTWRIQEIEELESSRWVIHRKRWKVRSHPQEVVENMNDPAHFEVVHEFERAIAGRWTASGPHLRTELTLRPGGEHEDIETVVRAENFGFGFEVVHSGVGELGAIVTNVRTPIDEEYLDCHATIRTPTMHTEKETQQLADMYVSSYIREFERDVKIWESKRYLERPRLCQADGPIAQYRKWCRQFYSDSDSEPALRQAESWTFGEGGDVTTTEPHPNRS